jgi:hypothetical protein
MEKQLGELFVEVFMFFTAKGAEHLPSLGPVQQSSSFISLSNNQHSST